MIKKDFVDIGDSSRIYLEEARGQAGRTQPPAKAAAAKPAEPAPEAKPPAYRFIGKATNRIDGRKIVTGQAKYTHDVKLRGMLIGKILRSPHAAAEIVSIDLAPAQALPGVMAALKLAEGKVRYAGQQVAAVAAVDERTAERALALIKVEYKIAPLRRRLGKSPGRRRPSGPRRQAQRREDQRVQPRRRRKGLCRG